MAPHPTRLGTIPAPEQQHKPPPPTLPPDETHQIIRMRISCRAPDEKKEDASQDAISVPARNEHPSYSTHELLLWFSPVVFGEAVEKLLISLVGGDENHLPRPEEILRGLHYRLRRRFHLTMAR